MLQLNQSQDILSNKEQIAQMIFDHEYAQIPTLHKIKQKYIEDTLYTLRFLGTSLELNEPMIFIQYMKWFGQLSFYLNFNHTSMKRYFESSKHIFSNITSLKLLDQMLYTYQEGVNAFDRSFTSTTEFTHEYDMFLKLLLEMNSEGAYQHIMLHINQGMTIKDVYLKILQPTLYQVGSLWQQKVITVAKEHYITAAIQNIIGRLYPILFQNRVSTHHTLTAVCAGNELHEIGMRMIADFFEMAGWDTIFLGSNIPVSVIIKQLIEYPNDVLAISSTNAIHLTDVKTLIQAIKSEPSLHQVKILVGGRAFNESPDVWKTIGADGYATDAEQAVLLATLLVGEEYGK
jgi:MerR family transcriptional regulator, light-induced transcriptional regulator